MADHGEVEYATATGNDYAEHEGTYQFFLRAVKWSVSVVVVILIGMASWALVVGPVREIDWNLTTRSSPETAISSIASNP